MLSTFRKYSGGMAAKIMLVLLIASFAVWGVGDMVASGGANIKVAKIGDKVITYDVFERELKREQEMMRARMGKNFSPDLLKYMGLEQQVISRMVNREVFLQEAEALGLLVSDEDVAATIRKDENFLNKSGKFDKQLFLNVLQQNNLTERGYVGMVRNEMAIQLLVDQITSTPVLPEVMLKNVHTLSREQRVADIITLTNASLPEPKTPDKAALEEFYNKHKETYTVPEYRTLKYVVISPEVLSHAAAPTEEEIKQAYTSRIEEFKKPERRAVEQMIFDTEEKAKATAVELNKGTSFIKAAADADIMNKKALSMGTVEKNELPDEAKEAVFKAQVNANTDVIKSPFGWHIFHISNVVPAGTAPYADVKAQIAKELSEDATANAGTAFANKLEDMLAGGSTLEEAAKELKLTVKTVGAVDANGNSPDGNKNTSVPALASFLEVAFKTDENGDSSVVAAEKGSAFLVHVNQVNPEHAKPLEQVKDEVERAWKMDARSKNLRELADNIAKELSDADKAAKIRNQYPVSTITVNRESKQPSPEVVNGIFNQAVGTVTKPYAVKEGFAIAAVKSLIPAKPLSDKEFATSKDVKDLRTQLENGSRNELMQQYTAYLRVKHNTTINEAALKPREEP